MTSLRRILPALLTLFALAASARASVFIPTKTTDSADGSCSPADCSLREAVLAANASAGEDVVLLRTGTYRLTLAGAEDLGAAGDLDVLGNLVLIGAGASGTIIDGGGIDRVLQVPGGITVEIRDVTLRNGSASGSGGAIQNSGRLTISNSVLSGNNSVGTGGGGLANAGLGGAIFTTGSNASLTVTASTIAANRALGGGGIAAVSGDVTLANVTLSGNRSEAGSGGGLHLFSDTRATVNNATIASNFAAAPGGGLFVETVPFISVAPEISNSVIALNLAPADPDCSGGFESSHNLVGNSTGCFGLSAATGDLTGTAAAPLDPRLGPLGENGGPTPTRALLAGSPAINAGNPAAAGASPACEASDQRAAARPGGTRCDIGAFEVTTACVAGGNSLCLGGGRFHVTATWKTTTATGPAQGVTLTSDSGFFWFFDPANIELTVKIVNACSLNNRWWFFVSGLTNQEVSITVRDTRTGAAKTYTNPQGRVFRSVLDTNAFSTCP